MSEPPVNRRRGRDTRVVEAVPWSGWGQAVASVAVLFQITAVLAGAMAAPPASPFESAARSWFAPYLALTNQGSTYRYYSRLDRTIDAKDPRPWATPVVTAQMDFPASSSGGRESRMIRLPDSAMWPRLRYQRHLALAFHVTSDFRWAGSYARHLCRAYGCERVRIISREHRIPPLDAIREAARSGSARPDLEADSTYSDPVTLGDFRCDDF
ncbi:MAG: hypothetical protein NVSMB9_35910 [Isosphaeraceae bacterium]